MRIRAGRPEWPVPRGFSTLELLVVLAILGVIGAIGSTAILSELRSEQTLAAANELSGWLESVRRSAERGIPCRVTINAGGNRTSTTTIASAEPEPNTLTSIPNQCLQNNPLRFDSGRDLDRYNVGSSNSSFVFTPRGSVVAASPIRIIIQAWEGGEGGEAVGSGHCVDINPPLAFITVETCP